MNCLSGKALYNVTVTVNASTMVKSLRNVAVQSLLVLALFTGLTSASIVPNSQEGTAASAEMAAGSSSHPHLSLTNYVSVASNLRHWDKSVVNVYIDAASNEGKSEAQTTMLVQQGMALWNDKLGAAVHLQPTTDAAMADIKLSFVPSGTLAGGAIGRTDVSFRLDDQILTNATVRLNRRLPSVELVQVAAHELGHALGIEGHSNDKRDLMYPYAHTPAVVTDRDLNTMEVSYPAAQTGLIATAPNTTHATTAVSSESDNAAEFPTSH